MGTETLLDAAGALEKSGIVSIQLMSPASGDSDETFLSLCESEFPFN